GTLGRMTISACSRDAARLRKELLVRIRIALGALAAAAFAFTTGPAWAADGLVATVPEASSAPTLDGVCTDPAYGTRAAAVLLWPASLGAPAGVVRAAWQ